ncbi:hypothetical protein M9435_002786 [Picochlorum sp. BPE23]|nr:hypothetical protein M9435_002786 [Picochlorum sp. BPE23]
MESTVTTGKEKRKSEIQLSKDDAEDVEGGTEGVFQKADDNVLKTRKICKVKRTIQTTTSEDGAKTKNPFASVTLQKETGGTAETKTEGTDKAKSTGLGGGFGGIASTSGAGGFGGLAAGSGNGFGGLAAAAGAGFGGLASSTQAGGLAFGKAAHGDEKGGADATTQSTAAVPVFGGDKKSDSQEKKQSDASNQESLKTGEEGEDTLYCCSASLYEFHDSQWKEKGKGMIKVNKDKEKKSTRLIMRQQGNLKLLLNANVWHGMKMTKMDESKGMSFTAVNHLEDASEASLRTFAIRAREAASINELYSTIQRAIDDM